MSIEESHSHFLRYEMRLEHNTTVVDFVFPFANLATAHPISQRNKGPFRGQSSSNGSYRGASHHIALSFHKRSYGTRECFGRGRGPPTSSTNSTPRQVCQVCNKPGHTTLTCYHKFYYSFQQENSSNMQAFAASSSPSSSDHNWYTDTRAANNVTADLANLNMQVDGYNGTYKLHVGNGQGLTIRHTGSSKLIFSHATFILKHLLHVPHIKKNLVSVSQFTRVTMFTLNFTLHFFCVRDPLTCNTLLCGRSRVGLYSFPTCPPPPRLALLGERAFIDRWHCRLGHPFLRIVNQVVRTHHLATLKNKLSSIYPACCMGKTLNTILS